MNFTQTNFAIVKNVPDWYQLLQNFFTYNAYLKSTWNQNGPFLIYFKPFIHVI